MYLRGRKSTACKVDPIGKSCRVFGIKDDNSPRFGLWIITDDVAALGGRLDSSHALTHVPVFTGRDSNNRTFVSRHRRNTRKEASMLVLSRQRDESIIIGEDIVVTIVDIRGDKVRLGIEAPSEIPVHRREIHEAIQRENNRNSQLETVETKRT